MTDTTPKPFVERLRERASQSKVGAGGRNRAAFLAVKPDVEAALADGWPVSQIWDALVAEKRIDFSYVWFAKFVRDLIRKPGAAIPAPSSAAPIAPSPAPIAAPVEVPIAAPNPDATPAEPPAEPRPRPARFHHPDSPKKEDYL